MQIQLQFPELLMSKTIHLSKTQKQKTKTIKQKKQKHKNTKQQKHTTILPSVGDDNFWKKFGCAVAFLSFNNP